MARTEAEDFWLTWTRTCSHGHKVDLRAERGGIECAECGKPVVRR